MEKIELGNTPMVVNTKASGGASQKGVSINVNQIAELPAGHHLITLPLDEHPFREEANSEEVEELRERLHGQEEVVIRITLHGRELPFKVKANLGVAREDNDFDIEGEVIHLYKASDSESGRVNINIGGMYLEMARALAQSQIEVNPSETGVNDPNQLPNITKVNIHFAYSACAVIIAMASLEAKVNATARGIFDGEYGELANAKGFDQEKIESALDNLNSFRSEYGSDNSRKDFYRYTKLTKKINLLYDAFGQTRLCDSGDKEVRKIWEKLIDLEDLRNNLVHPKGEALEEHEAFGLLDLEPKEVKKSIEVVAAVFGLLEKGLPIMTANLAGNAVIGGIAIQYADDPMMEHLMLTGTQYTPENRERWGTR